MHHRRSKGAPMSARKPLETLTLRVARVFRDAPDGERTFRAFRPEPGRGAPELHSVCGITAVSLAPGDKVVVTGWRSSFYGRPTFRFSPDGLERAPGGSKGHRAQAKGRAA